MRRATFAVLATAAGLILLLSFKPHDVASADRPPAAIAPATAPSAQDGSVASGSDSGSSGGDSGTRAGGSGSSSGGSGSSTGSRTVTGDAVDTRWGPVQVRITVAGGQITAVDAVVVPDANPRDREINSVAVPILTQEALAAQSARIDTVSGATYTSEGYTGSLQSALDKAGL
ncbi:FMN-binding protein [Sphaerisporangium album]|uniref:FMN-binding protein n=1 Tax=Sphaerisporangium album TaxID=509200 RepID=A0A367FGF4_9ACTN|nr:FMN-binding protein [Sphaerisporangium album]RCG29456.1 FMN-binding protein [Sphaerisporangium album]